MAPSVRRLTLGLGSGHDLMVCGSKALNKVLNSQYRFCDGTTIGIQTFKLPNQSYECHNIVFLIAVKTNKQTTTEDRMNEQVRVRKYYQGRYSPPSTRVLYPWLQ